MIRLCGLGSGMAGRVVVEILESGFHKTQMRLEKFKVRAVGRKLETAWRGGIDARKQLQIAAAVE